MAFILIIDDEERICRIWGEWLSEIHHCYDIACTYASAIEKIVTSETDNEGEGTYDLILLDHNLDGGFTGLQLLWDLEKEFDLKDYGQHRVVVITAATDMNIVPAYTRLGAIGHLIKPVQQHQFNATIIQALERRKNYLNYRENWEDAIDILKELGLLSDIEQIEARLQTVETELQILKDAYGELVQELEKLSNDREINRVLEAYRKATEIVQRKETPIVSIIPALKPFKVTESFLSDVREYFTRKRLTFHVLQAYLYRIGQKPDGHRVKHLGGRATGHYEYRIGRNHRLYFRRENGQIVLERFGDKNEQDAIIHYLRETDGGPVFIGDRGLALLS